MNVSVLLALALASPMSPLPAGPSDPSAGAAGAALTVQGDYVEARTCDVYTGACFANAEVNEAGKEATLAWKVRRGGVDGTSLEGLSVVAVVRANATLGDPYGDPLPSRSILLLDDRASDAERVALERFARERLGSLAGEVAEVRSVPISLEVGCCDAKGCARLEAGEVVSLETRCVGGEDHVCGNEEVYYPPLTDGVDAIPAVLTDHEVVAKPLGVRFQDAGARGAFTGTFRVAVAAAAPVPEPIAFAARSPVAETEKRSKYSLAEIPADAESGAPTLPDAIPAAFAERLDPKGVRVKVRDDVLYDLWFCREIVTGPAREEMSSSFGTIGLGELVGVVRSYGREVDYRESPIDAGFFALRYGLQPTDGDHLGTAPSRDFLILTGFEDDQDPAPVGDMEELGDLSMLVSSTDHPVVFYLLAPSGPRADGKEARARLVKHDERDEWVLDVSVPARGPVAGAGAAGEAGSNAQEEEEDGATDEGAAAAAKSGAFVRLGIVLVGVAEHY